MKIVIIQKSIPHYRIAFFQKLISHPGLKDKDILVVHGNHFVKSPFNGSVEKPAITWKIFNTELYWQNCWKFLGGSDLIIVEQANKLIFNYIIILSKPFFKYKIALWGHGFDHQTKVGNVKNKLKIFQANFIDWWFAYTSGVKKYLIDNGISESIITNVQNSQECLTIAKKTTTQPLKAIYLGSMYKAKGIDFVLKTCKLIQEKFSNFQIIFIGEGEDDNKVKSFCNLFSWAEYVGPKIGNEKHQYLLAADVLLIPRAIGLVVIDSFYYQAPIITTNATGHGPEFDYLIHGKNSLIINKNSPEEFSDAVVNLANDRKLLLKLKKGCLESSKIYTLENMVDNFVSGILKINALK